MTFGGDSSFHQGIVKLSPKISNDGRHYNQSSDGKVDRTKASGCP